MAGTFEFGLGGVKDNEKLVKQIRELLESKVFDRMNNSLVRTSDILSNISDNLYELARTLQPANDELKKFSDTTKKAAEAEDDLADSTRDATRASQGQIESTKESQKALQALGTVVRATQGFMSRYGVALTATGLAAFTLNRHLEALRQSSEGIIASGAFQQRSFTEVAGGVYSLGTAFAYGDRRAAQFGHTMEDVREAQRNLLAGDLYGQIGTDDFKERLNVMTYDAAAMARTFGVATAEVGKFASDVKLQLGKAGKTGTDAMYTLNQHVQDVNKTLGAGVAHGDLFAKSLFEFAADENRYTANLDRFAQASVKGFELAYKAAANHNLALKTSKELMKAVAGQTSDWLQTMQGNQLLRAASANWEEFEATLSDVSENTRKMIKDIVEGTKRGEYNPYEASRLIAQQLNGAEAGMKVMYDLIRTTLKDAPLEAVQEALQLSSLSVAYIVKKIAISGRGLSEFKKAVEDNVIKPSKEAREVMQDDATKVGLMNDPIGGVGKGVKGILGLPVLKEALLLGGGFAAYKLGKGAFTAARGLAGGVRDAATSAGGYKNLLRGLLSGQGGAGAAIRAGAHSRINAKMNPLAAFAGLKLGPGGCVPVCVVGGNALGGGAGAGGDGATVVGAGGAAAGAAGAPGAQGAAKRGLLSRLRNMKWGGKAAIIGGMLVAGYGAAELVSSLGSDAAPATPSEQVHNVIDTMGGTATGALAAGSFFNSTAAKALRPVATGVEIGKGIASTITAAQAATGGADAYMDASLEAGVAALSATAQWFSLGLVPAEWSRAGARFILEESRGVMEKGITAMAKAMGADVGRDAELVDGIAKTKAERDALRKEARNLAYVTPESTPEEIKLAAGIQANRVKAEKELEKRTAELNKKARDRNSQSLLRSLQESLPNAAFKVEKTDFVQDNIELSLSGIKVGGLLRLIGDMQSFETKEKGKV